jgi:hypothetical protein
VGRVLKAAHLPLQLIALGTDAEHFVALRLEPRFRRPRRLCSQIGSEQRAARKKQNGR